MSEAGQEARLRELFDRAVELPAAEQRALVDGIDDELLRERLLALLVQDVQGTAQVLQQSPAERMQGLRKIDRYELLRELGRGGMGTVVLARQLEPVERLVAIKLMNAGRDAPEVAQRFAAERQTLALMNHPGIARIFDGGETGDGVPYLVMEYVRGEPITDYCDRRRLDVGARVQLFVKVCDAVQHAHQKSVLHRDLKPGNVLVTEDTGGPQPKVIDFGIARVLAGVRAATQLTQDGAMVGTFGYMSPEQADTGGQDIDTRADIYSLGVLLYQLLSGELPLAVDFAEKGITGIRRDLLATTPPPASARLMALPLAVRTQHAQLRQATPEALCRALHGDLDWILRRTLEKDRNRRYESAAALAADLQRFLRHEPVEAGPPTVGYHLARFVRRHRLFVGAGALVLVGLLVGIAGTTKAMLSAQQAREAVAAASSQQARQLRRQRVIGECLETLLFYGDSGTGGTESLRQVLDTLTPSLVRRFVGKPVEEAAVRTAIGRVYLATGEPAKAEPQLRAAWQLERTAADPAEACMLLYDLSRARRFAGLPGGGREQLAQMLELGGKALASEQPDLARLLGQLQTPVLQSEVAWAKVTPVCEALLQRIAAMPPESPQARMAALLLAAVGIQLQEEAIPESEALLDRIEGLGRQNLGGDIDLLLMLSRYAESQMRLGSYARARRLAAEVLEATTRLGIDEHWLRLRAERIRGLSLALDGEPAAGETALVVLQRRLAALPPQANEQARAAAVVLAELCTRLSAAGRLDAFLAASLQRWQQAVAGDADTLPWWPADTRGLPAAATVAATAAVAQALAASPTPALQAMHGRLLLGEDQVEAAATALEAALAATTRPPPELLADVAVARQRRGQSVDAVLDLLRTRAAASAALAPRCEQALRRIAAERR